MNYDDLLQTSMRELLAQHPYIEDFLTSFGLQVTPVERTLQAYLDDLDPDTLEDLGVDAEQLRDGLREFIGGMLALADPM